MAKRLPKSSELTYRGSENADTGDKSGERKIIAQHGERIVGYLASSMERSARGSGGTTQRKLDLAWVAPEFRRRGVGATMVGLEKTRTGYTPIGDTALSERGSAFQKGIGVPTNPGGEVVSRRLDTHMEGVTSESVLLKQHRMLDSPQFDPVLVRNVAPYKAPRRKKQPQPEQLQLPGTENF